jgi:solute carrier family 25 carnitine/acylcarnitine transporter 20/29
MSELLNTQSDLKKSYYSDFIAGVFGGYVSSIKGRCAGVLTGHPFDTVKVRLQAENSKYRGTWHTVTSIVKEEKVMLTIDW